MIIVAVQIAKEMGATVTAVCGSSNVELVRGLGADEVVDYRVQSPETLTGTWEVIFDCVGKYSFGKIKHLLTQEGIFMTTDLSAAILKDQFISSLFGKKKAVISLTGLRDSESKRKDLQLLVGYFEKGTVRPLIDRVYDLEDITEAHAYVSSGRKKGNVVIKISENGDD